MSNALHQHIESLRRGVGLRLREDYTFIRFTGSDAASWLQSQTTNDVNILDSGQGHANALLDRQGRLQAHFTLHRWEDEYWMLVERNQAQHLMEVLDAHLFIEEVTMEETGGNLDQVVIQGPKTLPFLASLMDSEAGVSSSLLPAEKHGCHPVEILGYEALAFRASPSGEDGYVFVTEQGLGALLLKALYDERGDFEVMELSDDALDVMRIEAGLPRFGIDMDATNPIAETTLERTTVSYEKGCYLGQEVVVRLKTYGATKRTLMGLVFKGNTRPDTSTLYAGDEKIGRITSSCFSAVLGAPIAMAYLNRNHRAPDQILKVRVGESPEEEAVRVVVLPFHCPPTRAEIARTLYEEALTRFEKDPKDEDDSAVALLREAVLLDPLFEDAYEVLGVILHRHHRVDEAIYYMKILADLNPDCQMAHTNLSVFYVSKGMISEAEEEKAQADVIGMRRVSDTRTAKEMAKSERARIRAEAEEKLSMFKEVLEIDPDDPVATFGLGKAYIQLDDRENAVPHLQHAVRVQKDFSAAYLDLGKCHEFMDQNAAAIETYRQGIAAASRKGDLMPMREMERRLSALE